MSIKGCPWVSPLRNDCMPSFNYARSKRERDSRIKEEGGKERKEGAAVINTKFGFSSSMIQEVSTDNFSTRNKYRVQRSSLRQGSRARPIGHLVRALMMVFETPGVSHSKKLTTLRVSISSKWPLTMYDVDNNLDPYTFPSLIQMKTQWNESWTRQLKDECASRKDTAVDKEHEEIIVLADDAEWSKSARLYEK